MINGGSLINVTVGQTAAEQPWLVQLIGYPGIAVFLTAAVTWAVVRAGRSRKDLEDWRETRHAKYSQILIDADKTSELFRSARIHIEIGGEDVSPDDDLLDEVIKAKVTLQEHATGVRLMGYPEVFGGVNKLAQLTEFLEIWIKHGTNDGRKSVWRHSVANNASRDFISSSMDLEMAMRTQLGVGDPHPVRNWVKGPVKEQWTRLRGGRG